MNVPSVNEAKGFGTEVGVTGGEVYIIGASWITACEDNGDYIGSGGMVNLGLGGEATLVEVHTAMSYAKEIFKLNIYDAIDEFWKFLEDIFSGNTNIELSKN